MNCPPGRLWRHCSRRSSDLGQASAGGIFSPIGAHSLAAIPVGVRPSLGGDADRRGLQAALRSGVVQAVAVHAVPLDDEDMLLPLDQRPPGLSGHHLVLPRSGRPGAQGDGGWKSYGRPSVSGLPPSGSPAESLAVGTRRWLLFDPDHHWTVQRDDPAAPRAANLPLVGTTLQGRVIACGSVVGESDPVRRPKEPPLCPESPVPAETGCRARSGHPSCCDSCPPAQERILAEH